MLKKKLIATSLCCAFLMAGTAQNALAWGAKEVETEKIAVKFAKEVIRGEYKIVTTSELKTWLDEKKDMLIVDTMPYEDSYKKQHIPGAVQFELPIKEMTRIAADTRDEYAKLIGPDKDRLIVVYCGFTKCGRSHNGAMWAAKLGYTNVYRCPGGIKAWTEADYPVEK